MKLKLLFIVILVVRVHFCTAQTVEETCVMANELAAQNNNAQAIAYYKRALFFSEEDSITYHISLKLANLYEKQQAYTEAAHYYNTAVSTKYDEDSVLDGYTLKAALFLLREQKGQEVIALLDTNSLEEEIKDDGYYKKLLFLGLASVLEQNRVFAVSCFSRFYPRLTKADSIELYKLNQELLSLTYHREKTALIASLILPGLGQTINGDYRNGINSFVLNAAMIGLSVYTGISYNWINGALVSALLAPRYYVGGANMGAEAARNYNKQKNHCVYSSYVSFFKVVNLVSN